MKALALELVRFSRRNTLSALGGLVGLAIIVTALAAPLLAPRDPLKADFRRMNKPPDAQSLLGTDQVGRDTTTSLQQVRHHVAAPQPICLHAAGSDAQDSPSQRNVIAQ